MSEATKVRWLSRRCNTRSTSGELVKAGDVAEIPDATLAGCEAGSDYEPADSKPNRKRAKTTPAQADTDTPQES